MVHLIRLMKDNNYSDCIVEDIHHFSSDWFITTKGDRSISHLEKALDNEYFYSRKQLLLVGL